MKIRKEIQQKMAVTNLQIHNELSRRFKRVTSNSSKKINTEEWDAYFNEAYRAWVKARVSVAKTNSKVRYDLRPLEIINEKLKIKEDAKSWVIAELPKNYYNIQSIAIMAKCKDCDKAYSLDDVYFLQGNDWRSTISDPNWKPSFLWRRAPVDENSEGLRIGVGDYKIESIHIDYYRLPNPIYSVELSECYVDLRQTMGNVNRGFELNDFQMDEIVDIAVYYASRDVGNFIEAKTQYEKIINYK